MKQALLNYTLTFIITLLFYTGFSQKNYLRGHIIDLNGDTLSGFIDYKNWVKNPNKIHFKLNAENTPIVYTPIDILEFSVKDENYVSGIVDSENSPNKTDKLDETAALNIKTDTTFLQTLFKGEKCLYLYESPGGKANFYIKTDAIFELLMHKKYILQYDDKKFVRENISYISQLSQYLNDCPSIISKFKKISYNRKSLVNLFEFYYECTQLDIVFQKRQKKVTFEMGVLAGASLTTLQFKSDYSNSLANIDFDQSINFTAGLFFDLIAPRNQGKFSLSNELLYTSYSFEGYYEGYKTVNIYSITTKIGYSYIKLNALLRFKYPIGKLYLYINGGMSNGFTISETNYKMVKLLFHTEETIIEGVAIEETRKHEQGFIIGLGSKYKNFSFEIRYEQGNGMSDYSALNSTTKRLYMLVGFRFL